MTLRAFLSLLRDELRSTVTTRGYETRAGVPGSLGAVPPPPAAVEGSGAHPGGEIREASSLASHPPQDAPHAYPDMAERVSRYAAALSSIAAPGCIYRQEGRACRLLPDLDRGLWCPACLAADALNGGEAQR